MKKRYREEQIIKAIKEHVAGDKVDDICRDLNISNGTFYNWRSKYAELDDHLGYSKQEVSDSSNSRNGFMGKTLQVDDGQFKIDTPRDRKGRFEPQLVKKRKR